MAFDVTKYLEENKIEIGSIKKEVGTQVTKGNSDFRKTQYDVKLTEDGKLDLYTHKTIITESSIGNMGIVSLKPMWLNEAGDDDKYTHIGYGKYREKGKEKEDGAPTYKKDDSGKYIPFKSNDGGSKDSKKEPAKPKVNIFDKPKPKVAKPKPVDKQPEEVKYATDHLVYNKKHNTIGIVRDVFNDGGGDLRTDADGVVPTSDLEPYNPMKYPHQKKAKVAPSTKKEIEKRSLFKPFSQSKNVKKDVSSTPVKSQFKDLEKFINIAKTATDSNDFMAQVRKDTSVPRETAAKFGKMYGHLPLSKASEEFMKDARSGKFDKVTTNKTSTGEIPSSKLKDIMPKSDAKAFSGQSDIGKISPKQKKEISMKIDELAKISAEARAKGEQAPNYNLCDITVPGTNLYCDDNLGVPRADMPQFKGKPQPMSPASKMKVDVNGEVDTEPLFKKMLVKKGIKTSQTEIPSDALKATQSELVGAKVAGMTKALEHDPNHPGITAPIYVSRDGYVIDGHHRWAAITSMAIKNGKPANMKVVVIDDDAKNIIPMANKFAEEIGVAAKKADANQEGPTPSKQTDSTNGRAGNPKVNKFTRTLLQKAGITPQKLGKEEYQKKMIQSAYSALVDSNFSDEARKLIATIENNPKFAEDPTQRKDYVGFGKPGYEDWKKTTAWGSEYANGDDTTDKIGTTISSKSDWEGETALDSIAYDLKMNGFKNLASKIQSIFENKKHSTSLMKLVTESTRDDDYADELQREVEKVLKGKNIKGWKLYVDSRSGTFEYEKDGIDVIIYATPMWDGNPNLPFNAMDGDGDDIEMINQTIGGTLPFKPKYNLQNDVRNYIVAITKALVKVEQVYSKLRKK